MNPPRPLQVYLAREVINYIHERRAVDVAPYILERWKNARDSGDGDVVRISADTYDHKLLDLKRTILDEFGATVLIAYGDGEGGYPSREQMTKALRALGWLEEDEDE